jgi:3-hydroxyacyl-[acyl-carrier-protein] dehydratase
MSSQKEYKAQLSIDEILAYLPHRYPFLLVDRVLEISGPSYPHRLGRRVKAIKNVTYNEPFFPGHFPHRSVMPGVLQLECMAQVAALLGYNDPGGPNDVAIVAVDKCRFRRPVIPGDTLEVNVELLGERHGLLTFRGEITVGGQRASEAEILAKIFPMEKSE